MEYDLQMIVLWKTTYSQRKKFLSIEQFFSLGINKSGFFSCPAVCWIVCCLLSTVYCCLLSAVLVPTSFCLLSTACCLLSTVYCCLLSAVLVPTSFCLLSRTLSGQCPVVMDVVWPSSGCLSAGMYGPVQHLVINEWEYLAVHLDSNFGGLVIP